MITNSDLLDDYWRRYKQKRIATGVPMSQNETLGAVGAGLAHENDLARIAAQRNLEQQRLDMAKDAMKKQERAASISGIANMGQLAGSLYLGKGMLDVYNRKLMPSVPTTTTTGVANGSVVTGGSGVPMASAGVGPSSIPYSSSGIAGNMGQGLGTTAPAATGGGSTAMGMVAPIGEAAALYGAQYETGKLTKDWMDDHDMKYANRGWTFGGLPGASIGLTVDFGKKLADAVEDFFGGIF